MSKVILLGKRRWCSGIMQDSHSCDPGSIPGRCIRFLPLKLILLLVFTEKHSKLLSCVVSKKKHVTPGGTRTHNPWLRRPMPYPLGHGGNIASG